MGSKEDRSWRKRCCYIVARLALVVCIYCAVGCSQEPRQDSSRSKAIHRYTHTQFDTVAPPLILSSTIRGTYGYFSANTRTWMDFKEAQGSLTSFEQANIIGVADYLVCHLFGAGELRSTLGDGTDGAENSAFVHVSGSFERGQYLMALLGRYAHQEYVIIFSAAKNGQAVLWQLKAGPSAGIERLRSVLDASGIKYRTIDSERAGTTVYVFDADHTLHDGLLKAATAVGATMEGIRGEGQLLGSPNRDDAMKVFDRVVTDHERAHPEDTFSRQLWSQQLHDTKNRTCTSGSGSE